MPDKKKKRSTHGKATYYRYKTKQFFLDMGYDCEYAEKYQRHFFKGKVFHRKTDLFGADGIAMNGEHLVFWNSKFGRENISKGIIEFLKYKFPVSPQLKLWIVVWEPRQKPEIVDVREIHQEKT